MRRSVFHQALVPLLIKSSLHLCHLRSTEYRTLAFTHLPSWTFPTRTPIFPQFAVGNLYFLLLFSAFLCCHFHIPMLSFFTFLCCLYHFPLLFHFPLLSFLLSSVVFFTFLCYLFHFPLLSSLLSSVDSSALSCSCLFSNFFDCISLGFGLWVQSVRMDLCYALWLCFDLVLLLK